MMVRFFLLVTLFIFNFSFGQMITSDIRMSTSKYNAVVKDSSQIVVLYELSRGKKSNPPKNGTSAQVILQIGKRFSKFLDVNTLRHDSLMEAYSHQKTVGTKEINELLKYRALFTKDILKDLTNNKVLIKDRFKLVYQYEEGMPEQKWMLSDEKTEIMGFNCKKANLEFRGRKYQAWYTPEIPVSNGPYLFGGLPGLIMRISDENEDYTFVAVAVEKKKSSIYWKNEEKDNIVSREDFRKIQRNYFENPGLFIHGKAYDANGNEIVPKFPSIPYNPIELE